MLEFLIVALIAACISAASVHLLAAVMAKIGVGGPVDLNVFGRTWQFTQSRPHAASPAKPRVYAGNIGAGLVAASVVISVSINCAGSPISQNLSVSPALLTSLDIHSYA